MKKLLLLITTMLIAAIGNAQELKPYQGDKLPDFSLIDLHGSSHRLSDYRGKAVMVNFWATYCGPCIREMPSMQRLKEKLTGRPFEILAIDMAEEQADVENFMQRHNIVVNFPLLLDTEGTVIEQWRVSAVPTTFILDPQGHIRYAHFGTLEWDSDEVVSAIEALMK